MKSSDSNTTSYINTLLVHYCLDLEEHSAQYWVNQWVEQYSIEWIKLAVTEALYLGRYKAVSVEQILVNWKRRGRPSYRFTKEFERLISRRFPRNLRELKSQPISALVPPTFRAASSQPDWEASEMPESAVSSKSQSLQPPGKDISYNLKLSFQQDTPVPNYFFKPEEIEILSQFEDTVGLPQSEAVIDPWEDDTPLQLEVQPPQVQPLEEKDRSLTPLEVFASLSPEMLSQQVVSDMQLRSLVESDWPEDKQLRSLVESDWPENKQKDQLPLVEGEPILQFVPKRVQTSLYEKLKAIAELRASRGSTFAVIESLMAQAI